MTLASGHSYAPLKDEEQQRYNEDLPGVWRDVVRLQPGGWIMTSGYLALQENVYNFKFRPDDVLIMTYPKCGTTWTQEIIWTMRDNPDLSYPRMKDALFVRSPYIEMDMLGPKENSRTEEDINFLTSTLLKGVTERFPTIDLQKDFAFQIADNIKGGRTLKTHLPFSFFPKTLLDTCKVVYVARNVKDNLVSAYHHYKNVPQHGFTGDMDTFIKYYTEGLLLYGNYATHLAEACALRSHRNLHMLFYEDLKEAFIPELKRLASFIGTGLNDQQMINIQKQTSFSTMKSNDCMKDILPENAESFFRKGESGSWKGEFSPAQEDKLNQWISSNIDPLGIDFKYQ